MGRGRCALVLLLLALGAVAVLVGVVALASSWGQRRASPSARSAASVPVTGAPREANRVIPAGRSPEERAALRAARRFLEGYLPFSYGRGSVSEIAGAASPLREQLRRAPPRVGPEDRGLAPRLVDLEVASSNGDLGLDVAAVVDDGRRRYSMIVAVRPAGDRWLVTALS